MKLVNYLVNYIRYSITTKIIGCSMESWTIMMETVPYEYNRISTLPIMITIMTIVMIVITIYLLL